MRDEVYRVIREFDEGIRKPKYSTNGPYVGWYQDGDSEEDILVFDDWESVRDLEEAFFEIVKDEEDFHKRSEDEYDTSALDFILDGIEHWTFSDEGYVCSECNRWFFYDDRGYVSYQNYFVGDGYILCHDCTKEDSEPYFESLINEPTRANTLFDNAELMELGWQRVNERTYDNGWYEWNTQDQPEEILKKALEQNPDGEYIFVINKTGNPWETEFDLWERKAKHE